MGVITEHAAVPSGEGSGGITVSELFEAWLAGKRGALRPSTYRHYASEYRLYLEKPLGGVMVSDVTPERWRSFEETLLRSEGAGGKPLSLPTVRKLLRLFHTVFAYGAEELGLNDPTGDCLLPEDSVSSETVFSPQEVERLMTAVKPYNVHHLGIMLCICTGIQNGELCGAKWGDIDTDEKLLRIRRSLVRESKPSPQHRSELVLTDARSKRTVRDVHIPDWINDQFRLVKKMHADEDMVIVGKNGGVEPNNFVSHYYAEFLGGAGVRYRPFSATRNTFVRNSIKSGMSIETLSRLLGDPNTEYTRQKYYNNEEKNEKQG